jgi:hypothetical protein
VKGTRPLAAAIAVAAVLAGTSIVSKRVRESRSTASVSSKANLSSTTTIATQPPAPFRVDESAALFVGVRKFESEEIVEVPYAVDDAVDLAHRFILDSRIGLVRAQRSVLALSGKPVKPETQQRLAELIEAGVRVEPATQTDLVLLLEKQAELAGANGILIVSVASHGFTAAESGEAYILGSTSVFRYPDTALAAARLFDIVSRSRARRSLVLVDACRDRVTEGTRGGEPDPRSAAPHLERMQRVAGQVVFYAAAAGHYAYDDHALRNGVFTRAVLDGLSCTASKNREVITVAALRDTVSRRVLHWLREHGKPLVEPATQFSFEGDAHRMPLAHCRGPAPPIPHGNPVRASFKESTLTAWDKDGIPLWHHSLPAPATGVDVADLDLDGMNEVIAGGGEHILVLDHRREERWTIVSGAGVPMIVRAFVATRVLYGDEAAYVVALWNDPQSSASRITIHGAGGDSKGTWDHPARVEHLATGRATNRSAPRIAAATRDTVFLLDPKKLAAGKPVWALRLTAANDTIRGLRIDGDERRQIVVTTARGTSRIAFDGTSSGGVWQKLASRKKGAR